MMLRGPAALFGGLPSGIYGFVGAAILGCLAVTAMAFTCGIGLLPSDEPVTRRKKRDENDDDDEDDSTEERAAISIGLIVHAFISLRTRIARLFTLPALFRRSGSSSGSATRAAAGRAPVCAER